MALKQNINILMFKIIIIISKNVYWKISVGVKYSKIVFSFYVLLFKLHNDYILP